MSKLRCALAVAASVVSMVTGVILLSQEAMAAPSQTVAAVQSQLDARAELKSRLEALTGFSAHFKQELTDTNDVVMTVGEGVLYLLRPHHFLMHSKTPDELAFFTQGNDLYYYDAAVNQLTISSLAGLSTNPLMLLADVGNVSWDDYEVRREGEFFIVVPRNSQDVRNLILAFSQDGSGPSYLSALTIRMDDGTTNFYLFTKPSFEVDPSVFDFPLPADVEIDDLR